jgi:plasmid stabilization system protein ParE
MTGFALHPEAFTDIDDIREYIAQDNPDAAGRMIKGDLRRNARLGGVSASGLSTPKAHFATAAVQAGA